MAIICPAILAETEEQYVEQIDKVSPFAKRIQIDLTDGEFAPSQTIKLEQVWWPPAIRADIHLMYKKPMDYLKQLTNLNPNMVIIHAEAEVNHMYFAAELHKENIAAGLAILPDTSLDNIEEVLDSFDHILIFSGDLGHFGGKADLDLLTKVQEYKSIRPELEIGWDGGVNDENAAELSQKGVDVLNVGGFIQKSENPKAAYDSLVKAVES